MGLFGLTGNPGALRHWMVAGPKIARITTEFEERAIKQLDGADDTGNITMNKNKEYKQIF